MDRRKMQILHAVTDDYISTAEPVGSRTIARKYKLGLSPATIRNEMADLEEAGYLEQPHTSAGRIPSDQGFRFYVDILMTPDGPSEDHRRKLQEEFESRSRAASQLVHCAARLLALLSGYTSIITAPSPRASKFRHIDFIPLDGKNVLVIFIAEPGVVRNKMVECDTVHSRDKLDWAADRLNQRLGGKDCHRLGAALQRELDETAMDSRLLEEILRLLGPESEGSSAERVYLEGAVNVLNQPEFQDIERARTLFRILEEEDTVFSLLTELAAGQGVSVSIGRENRLPEMQSCSMITCAYRVGDETAGAVGIVGPTRMDYARAVALVDLVASSMTNTMVRGTGW